MSFRIHLEKENFKFSGSHFTIFGPGHAERLHGHNYYVSVEIEVRDLDPRLGMAFDFNTIKPLIREICETLDERVLVPLKSEFLGVKRVPPSVELKFSTKTYVLPEEDTMCLDLVNITSEELARYFATRLSEKIQTVSVLSTRISSLTVGVEETRGQTVTFTLRI